MTKERLKNKLLALKLKKELAEDKTRRAARLLFYIGFAHLVCGLVQAGSFINVLFVSSISLVIIVLGLLSPRNPLVPLILAFVLLTGAYCIDFVHFERIGFTGLIIRILLLGFLASGIYQILIADRIISEYDRMQRRLQE